MPGLSFLNKKSWHTTNVKNVERVWLAEKKAEEEQKRLAELQKQLQEERQILELRQLQAAQGQVTKTIDNSLDWMYEGPVSSNQKQQSSEEYLLGKIYNPTADRSKIEAIPDAKAPAKWLSKVASKNDSFSRAHEDPFVMIKQEENRRREKVINNPIKMDKIKQKIATELQEKDEKKRLKKLAKREKKEQKKEAKRRRKEGRREGQNEKDGSSSSSGSDSEGSDQEDGAGRGRPREDHLVVVKKEELRTSTTETTRDKHHRSRSPSPVRGARTADRSEYSRDNGDARDSNRDDRFVRRGGRDSRNRDSQRDSRDRGNRSNNARDRPSSRDRNDRYNRDREDRRDVRDRERGQRDSRDRRGYRNDRNDRYDRNDRRSNSRSRELRDRRDFDRNTNNSRSNDERTDTRKRERSPSPAAAPPAADRNLTTRHTMQSDSEDSDVSGPRKPKQQQYGLLPNKNRRPDLASSASSSTSLGPNPALLQKKLEAEKAAEAALRNRTRGDVRGLSEEERQRRILAMQEDAQTNDIVRSSRHESQRNTETEENTGNAAFLESMRKTVYTTNDIDMQSRIDQNKYNRQSSAEIDSADGFLRK